MPCIFEGPTIPERNELAKNSHGLNTENSDTKKRLDVKESFPVSIGSYNGTTKPMIAIFIAYISGMLSVAGLDKDPRLEDFWLVNNSLVVVGLSLLYVVFSVVWGPRFMRNRPAYNTRKFMIAYNAFQVIFNTYMFIELGLLGWFFDYSFTCQPIDHSYDEKPLRLTRVVYLFYMSKLIDWIDTALFVLNKKFTHLSVLHITHHSLMVICIYFGARYTPGGHLSFVGFINSAVHSVMYTYYLFAALGPAFKPYLWWKKYITTIQLAQFSIVFIHVAQVLFNDCSAVPKGFAYCLMVNAVIFTYLFMDFYNHAYKAPQKKMKPAENGFAVTDKSQHKDIVKRLSTTFIE